MERKILVASILLLLLLIPIANAQTTSREEAELGINSSVVHITEMNQSGIPISRVNDLLAEAMQLYKAQVVYEDSGGSPNYQIVKDNTDEIARIKKKAFNTYDEILALRITLQDAIDINQSRATAQFDQIMMEFNDERFDQASDLVESLYEQVSEEQALSTKVSVFLDAAGSNIVSFLITNWVMLSISSITIIFLLAIFHSQIAKARVRRKIRKLDLRKSVLNEMIKGLQKDYFELGTVSEVTYKVKINKFKQLLRDIERQKPLLREELAKHS